MATIKVSADEMEILAEKCGELAKKYQEDIFETEKIVSLINEIWHGNDLNKYTIKLQVDLRNAEETIQTLRGLRELLFQTGEAMRCTEEEIINQIRGNNLF